MEVGSNKSLFTLIAVVIFGIFIGLSYFLFQDQMKSALATVMDKTSQSVVSKTDFDTISNLADISDPILAANIRSVLGLAPDKVLTKTDLESLTSLTLIGKNITSIEGLQYAKNLTYLNVCANQISDITPLTGLTNLKTLWIESNRITDMSNFVYLKNLTHLYMYNNRDLTNIKGVEGMDSLIYLDIQDSRVSDLTPIANLIKLEVLDIQSTPVSNLTPLTNLLNLQKISLVSTNVSDVSPILNKPLTKLYLYGTQVTDFSGLNASGIPYNTTTTNVGVM